MEHFVIMVNGFQLSTITIKSSILDVATVLDPPFLLYKNSYFMLFNLFLKREDLKVFLKKREVLFKISFL